MDTLTTIKRRRSIRTYTDKQIDKETLEKIVDAARFAPTARAIEPWEFIVVTDKEKIKTLAEITDHGKFMKEATASILVFCQDTKYYLEDGCAATQNILLAACELGVGTCWIAGDKKPYAKDISEMFAVGDEYKLVSILSLGYAKEDSKRDLKKNLSDCLHWEKF